MGITLETFKALLEEYPVNNIFSYTEKGCYYATMEDPFAEDEHTLEEGYREVIENKFFLKLRRKGLIVSKKQHKENTISSKVHR